MAFPTVPTVANGRLLTTNQADTLATRTFPNLSSLTKNSGDLLIAICAVYQSSAAAGAVFSGWSAGWTEFSDTGGTTSNMSIGMAYKFSTGSETGTITVTQAATITGHAAMILLSIPGVHPTAPPEHGAQANGTSGAADPAALTPSWGAADTLWIAVGADGETSATGTWTAMNAGPTNYTDYKGTEPPDSSTIGQAACAVAFRQLNAASEDAGAFSCDTSNARNSALLVAVRPDPTVRETPGVGAALGDGVTPAPSASATIQGAVAQGVDVQAAVAVDPGGALAAGFAPTEDIGGGGVTDNLTLQGGVGGGNAPVAQTSASLQGATGAGNAPTASSSTTAQGGTGGGLAPVPTVSSAIQGAVGAGNAATVSVTMTLQGATGGGFAPSDGGTTTETPTPGGAIGAGNPPTASTSATIGGAIGGGTAATVNSTVTAGGAVGQGTQPAVTVSAVLGGAVALGTSPTVRVNVTAGGALAAGTGPHVDGTASEAVIQLRAGARVALTVNATSTPATRVQASADRALTVSATVGVSLRVSATPTGADRP